MLLVILGAGASNDYVPAGSTATDPAFRPPLTEGLVADSEPNRRVLAGIPMRAASPVVGDLRRLLRRSDDLEEILDGIVKVEGETSRPLVALRFYLQALLGRASESGVTEIGAVTNHAILVRRLEQWRAAQDPGSPILYVTFNYDTLIEQALASQFEWAKPNTGPGLTDYISHDEFRLIKLHGSVSWGHVTNEVPEWSPARTATVAHAMDVVTAARAAVLRSAGRRELTVDTASYEPMRSFGSDWRDWVATVDGGERYLLPALAVPLKEKAIYLCPQSHQDHLQRLLPEVDRIISIGWKAGEPDFVGTLATVREGAYVFPVSRRKGSRTAAYHSMAAANPTLHPFDEFGDDDVEAAFTALVEGDLLQRFLTRR